MTLYVRNLQDFINTITNTPFVVSGFIASDSGSIPLKKLEDEYEQLANLHPKKKFIRIDTDRATHVADYCDIKQFPTFKIYQKGKCTYTLDNLSSLALFL
tara:strand:- start:21 stop:320 length:300 start_codon:yes stop_codon:yes gene_type:complete